MQNSKVSAIIPTYNRPETTIRAIKSILAQTRPCDEILVIDDCSTDGSFRIIKDFIKTKPLANIKITKLDQNKGVSAARNEGIKIAQNPWLAFLDSDDEWAPDKLEKQMTSLLDSGLFISHTDESWIRNGKVINQKKQHQKFGGYVYAKAIKMCFIGPSTSIIHQSVFEDAGLFDEDFIVCEDYDLWLRVTPKYEVHYVSEPLLIKYGGHEDQLSTAFKGMDYWRAKALKKQILNPQLTTNEKALTTSLFKEKIDILISGCKKHQNHEFLEKITKTLL